MSEVIIWMIITTVLILFVFFETMFIMFSSPRWLFRMIKYRFRRGKGVIWLTKVLNNGAIQFDLTTLKSNIVKFGKADDSNQSQITQIYHYEADSGIPIHFVIEGTETNVNLNAKYIPSENAALLNQAMARFYNAGLITGQNIGLKPKMNFVTVILIVLVLLAVIISIFYGIQAYEILKEVAPKIATLAGG